MSCEVERSFSIVNSTWVFIEEPFVILYVVTYFWVLTQKKERNTKQYRFKRHSSSSSSSPGRATEEEKLFDFFFCFFPPHSLSPLTYPYTIKTQHLQLSRASTRMSQYIERAKKALNNKQRHLMIMEHQKGGDLYFKPGKNACMSSNLKALHIYFWFVTRKSSIKLSKNVDKERIIELIIK